VDNPLVVNSLSRKKLLALVLAVAALAVALSACGSSSGGSSSAKSTSHIVTSAALNGGTMPQNGPGEESEEGGEEPVMSKNPNPVLKSELEKEIFGRWGGNSHEFKVAGGVCNIDKINTSEAEIKAGGEAILDEEHNGSVLVTPADPNADPTVTKECEEAIAIAIG
jgi:hypothetical protein